MTKNPLIDRILKTSSIELKSVLSDSDIFNNKDVIPTPIPIINGAFSGDYDGGIVSGLTILAGQSKSFKSMLGLLCMKSYLDKYPEAVAIIYDCEGGITTSYLKSFGIDADRVVLMPFNHLEELKFDLTKQLVAAKRGDKVFIFVDSIGNAASLKELQDAIDEKSVADMQRAKFIKGLFRIITPSLVSKDIPCVMIAHVYSEMGMFPRTIVSGGSGIMLAANQVFIITKSQEKEGGELVGYNFTITIEKSRFVKEKSKFTFSVTWDKGIRKYSGLMDVALESGHVIKPSNGWYQRVDMDTGEVIDKKYRMKETFTKEFWQPILDSESFKSFFKNKFQLGHDAAEDEEYGVDDSEEKDTTDV